MAFGDLIGCSCCSGLGPAFGQGCAMCYSSAKAVTKDGQNAISRGVLVLLIPPGLLL